MRRISKILREGVVMCELTESDVQRMHSKWLRVDGGIEAEKCHQLLDLRTAIIDLRSKLRKQSEDAYCDMISIMQKDEALGWEAKVQCGKFGSKELEAHCLSRQRLGCHLALIDVCFEIDELLKK